MQMAQSLQHVQLIQELDRYRRIHRSLQSEVAMLNDLLEAVQKEFECPVTCSVPEDPVLAPDGYTYERAALEQCLSRRALSPVTRQPMAMEQAVAHPTCRRVMDRIAEAKKRWHSANLLRGSPRPHECEEISRQGIDQSTLRFFQEYGGLAAMMWSRDGNYWIAMAFLSQGHYHESLNALGPHGASLLHDVLSDEPHPFSSFSCLRGDSAFCGFHAEIALAIIARPDFEQVNATNEIGATALHLSARLGFTAGCHALLLRADFREEGARLKGRGRGDWVFEDGECFGMRPGDTALDIARRHGHSGIVRLLSRNL
uniref:U-box domain-containing protein n=1 Tax=Alexandrium monilatum TaxID=311494 RepID=A0A7S4RGN3_9DINO